MNDKEIKKDKNTAQPMTTEEKVKENMKKRKARLRRKRIINWSIFALIIALGIFTYSFYTSEGRMWWTPAADTNLSAAVSETTVQKISISQTIDLSGEVEPYDIQEAVFRSDGAVTQILVKEGDTVTKGQLLATIDDTSQQYQIAYIESEIASAELEGSLTDLKLYEMELTEAETSLDFTRVYANFDGVVAEVDIDEDDYVEAGTTVMTIVDTSKLIASVEIDEIDMQSVELGMEAVLSFDAVPSEEVIGYVNYIPLLGRTTDQGIGVKDVELIIEEYPEGIASGYTFAGVISQEEEEEALVVLSSAINTDDDDNSTLAIRGDDGSVSVVLVKAKYLGEGMSEILSGDVEEGDVVVIASEEDESGFQLGFGAGPGSGGGDRRPPAAQ
ncbi:MAG: efflux RND transporter periplasmic adaptor subunit [Sphaerochaetaceae bacterium]